MKIRDGSGVGHGNTSIGWGWEKESREGLPGENVSFQFLIPSEIQPSRDGAGTIQAQMHHRHSGLVLAGIQVISWNYPLADVPFPCVPKEKEPKEGQPFTGPALLRLAQLCWVPFAPGLGRALRNSGQRPALKQSSRYSGRVLVAKAA